MNNINKIFSLCLLGIILLLSCAKQEEIYNTELVFTDFNNVIVKSAASVSINYGKKQNVLVYGNQESIKSVVSDVMSNTLTIDESEHLQYIITIPEVREVVNESNANIVLGDFAQDSYLNISTKGKGSIEIGKFNNVSLLNVSIEMSGKITAYYPFDSLTDLSVVVNGTADFDALPIKAKNVIVEINSSGSCYIYPLKELNATITGSGNIYYKGSPTINSTIEGSGALIDIN